MSEIAIWEKVYKVIDSCKTKVQLDGARRYANFAFETVSTIGKDKSVMPEYKDEVSYANALTAINVKQSILHY